MNNEKSKARVGFTLLELLIVVTIIGIIMAISIPTFIHLKEKALRDEAFATLKMLRAAQKAYHMDKGVYFNSADHSVINSALKVHLPVNAKRNWNYSVRSSSCVDATRRTNPNVSYHMFINEEEPTPNNCTVSPSPF